MPRKPFTEHPEFMNAGRRANEALMMAAMAQGVERELMFLDEHANRVVDDMTRLLLRAYDRKQKSASPVESFPSESAHGD